jgi:predicted nucleic acid-binding protein
VNPVPTISTVCVDVNVALKLVLLETDSDKAQSLFEKCVRDKTHLIVPTLFWQEAASALCNNAHRGRITSADSIAGLQTITNMPLQTVSIENLHLRALEVALRLKQPQAYDAHYLVVMQEFDCEFWTADERLYRTALNEFPKIKWLGNY